jgi:serine kinase of HPr protein (carbohydrate metabolism regulator)
MTDPVIRHAGFLAVRLGGYWRGALIEGPSGAGKSDLALRALDRGFNLVADDRTLIFVSGGRLFGRAPSPLAGLIEARGLGVLATPALPFAEIILIAQSRPGVEIERCPEFAREEILGLPVPVIALCPLEASAPAKLRRALEQLGEQRQQAYQSRSRSGLEIVELDADFVPKSSRSTHGRLG